MQQGDIFWVELEEPASSEPEYRHSHVVIQTNVFNRSRIRTFERYGGSNPYLRPAQTRMRSAVQVAR
jgi:hypothetical protein